MVAPIRRSKSVNKQADTYLVTNAREKTGECHNMERRRSREMDIASVIVVEGPIYRYRV
jgi:hypothetical protein